MSVTAEVDHSVGSIDKEVQKIHDTVQLLEQRYEQACLLGASLATKVERLFSENRGSASWLNTTEFAELRREVNEYRLNEQICFGVGIVKPPIEWMTDDIRIVDPDGWRTDFNYIGVIYPAKDFNEPISEIEFKIRLSVSTVMGMRSGIISR